MTAIEINGLTKSFGTLKAVEEMHLSIDHEIFGLLGPNGSGKTTTVRMLTTILRPTSGDASVCGHSVLTEPRRVRDRISYVPQDMAVDAKLTGRENVVFFAKLYGVRNPRDKADEALARMELGDRADDLARTYSGGMRRRLELAQALVHDPEVLFLDEPTIGLDVAGRKKIWEHIIDLKNNGMTVFVTTHYMDEADYACDRVGIIDHGVLVANDSPEALKARCCNDIIVIRAEGEYRGTDIEGVRLIGQNGDELRFEAGCAGEMGFALAGALAGAGMKVKSFAVRQPTLDDVFLSLVAEQEETAAFDYQRFRTMLRRRA
ncbi:MAG: type transport system ATP-binding protein [Methanolobus sp.]|jgi:ABC-2 type transport system ATP-binding protein|nr:type transport system ATP-binding protein [Methanolobus sp.]MDK2834183.1 type transport system ATP-binding protein [Methanolobus sp.]